MQKAKLEKKEREGGKSVHRAVNASIQRNMQILLVMRDDHKIWTGVTWMVVNGFYA